MNQLKGLNRVTSSMIEFSIFKGARRYFCKEREKEVWSYDRAVETIEADWTDVIAALSERTIVAEKEIAPMVAFQTFLPFSEVEGDEKRTAFKWGEWDAGRIYTKAIAKNVVSLTAITVDMESIHWPIKRFLKIYEDLEFFLGTSYKHASEADHGYRHRYRAIFPLVTPMPIDCVRAPAFLNPTGHSVLADLKGWFPGCDKSTFDRSRCVHVPSCPEDRKNDFLTVHNKGAWFDWDNWLRKEQGTKGAKKSPPKAGTLAAMKAEQMNRRARVLQWSGVDDCPFVKKDKLAEYLSTPHGEHHRSLYRMMCSIATTATSRGRPLELDELTSLTREIHMRLPCNECDKTSRNYEKEANKVLSWANGR